MQTCELAAEYFEAYSDLIENFPSDDDFDDAPPAEFRIAAWTP